MPTTAVFFETPSNPMQSLVDVRRVSELAHAAGAKVVLDNVFATPLLQRSLAIDPGFARAWTGLAVTYAGLADMEEYPANIQNAREAAARKAVTLDPGDAQAHAALATYYMDTGDAARAEAEFDKALRLNPGSADLLAIYAGWASNFGEPEKGVAAAEQAMRLNPDTPAWAMYNFAYAYFMADRFADALRTFDRMPVDAYPPSAYIYRAAALGALGQTEAAKLARLFTTCTSPIGSPAGTTP